MNLTNYRSKIFNLNANEKKLRDLYLRKLSLGIIQGPGTGYASLDKPWLRYYDEKHILSDLPKMKIYDYLFEQNKDHLSETALNFEGFKCTFQDLFDRIDETAKAYQEMGVKEGDIVTICMPTLPETIYSFYALNKIGAIPDMIDPRASVEQLEFYLNETNSKYLLVYDECLVKIHAICKETKLETVILSSAAESMKGIKKIIYNTFIKKRYIKERAVKNDPVQYLHMKEFMRYANKKSTVFESKYKENSFAFIVHSSGTTSLPKGIKLSNDNANALAFQYKMSPLDLQRQDRFLSVIPAFAAFGMVASVHLPLSLGMEVIIVPKPVAKKFDRLFLKYHPHHCLTVPRNYEALSRSKKIKDLSYFKSPGCGGDAPNEEQRVNDFLKSKGCKSKLLKGWGMSEFASTACLENNLCTKMVSNGVPLVKNTITVVDPVTKEELTYNQEGELALNGPTQMLEYYNNPTLTAKAMKNDENGNLWLYSGDVGYLESDGCTYITDRIDRMIIKYDGKKICPRTIENAILTNPMVENCCVVTAISNLGKVPKAYIVLKEEFKHYEQEALREVEQTCKKLLEERVVPDAFEIIDELPFTPMEKIDYKKLERESVKVLIKK